MGLGSPRACALLPPFAPAVSSLPAIAFESRIEGLYPPRSLFLLGFGEFLFLFA